jgi:8-oxo-dGTP diphosphatase
MANPVVHLVQILVRDQRGPDTVFLVYPHDTWRAAAETPTYLVLPTKKTVGDAFAEFLGGNSLEGFVRSVMEDPLGLSPDEWLLEEEISPVRGAFRAVHSGVEKDFVVCPVDVWVSPDTRTSLAEKVRGLWFTPGEALAHEGLAPSTRAVFRHLLDREKALDTRYAENPAEESREESPHRLLRGVPDRPSMYALASRWLSRNRGGVRILERTDLNAVLAAGNRAFNLRVADPYLRYQLQGVGFTWSFFTHKDGQDVHVHSAPTVEIYGVLEGQLEVWWKPYHDRGTSAWNHRVVGPGAWVEMEALQCHYVRWRGDGRGVVFKAGPGPLAEVGKLGVKGKTRCDNCPCIKPPEMLAEPRDPRVEVLAAGKPWGLSVAAFIRDEAGRLLLLRRSRSSRFHAGQWEPPGGKLDHGETFDAALRREVLEETGLEVALVRCLGATDHEMPHIKVTHLFHEAEVTGGSVRLSHEHDEYRWVSTEELASLDLAPKAKDVLLGRA